MKWAHALALSLLGLVCLQLLLAGCSSPDAPAETPALATLEPTVAIPADDDTGDNEIEESSNLDLAAVIVSGDSASAGKPFTFDATQSEFGALDIVHYQWNMGDGTTLFGISVQHAYAEPGIYTVTLTVIDEEGNSDVMAKTVEILEANGEPPLTAEAEFTLVGSLWILDYPLRGTTVTLEFDEESISGSAGCNTYSASYTAVVTGGDPADIDVGKAIINSSKICTYEIMAQEEGFLESLESASTVIVDEQKLTLETARGTLTFSQVEVTG